MSDATNVFTIQTSRGPVTCTASISTYSKLPQLECRFQVEKTPGPKQNPWNIWFPVSVTLPTDPMTRRVEVARVPEFAAAGKVSSGARTEVKLQGYWVPKSGEWIKPHAEWFDDEVIQLLTGYLSVNLDAIGQAARNTAFKTAASLRDDIDRARDALAVLQAKNVQASMAVETLMSNDLGDRGAILMATELLADLTKITRHSLK